MAELLAQGKEPLQHWQQAIPDQPVTLGRTDESKWQVPWDKKISRVHASLEWHTGLLLVRRVPGSLNPIFYQGAPRDVFQVPPGGRFVIGDTTFTVLESATHPSTPDLPAPSAEVTCSAEELHRYQFVDPDERIEVLAALPGVIRFSPSDAELESQVAAVLLRGIPRAQEAAIVCLRGRPASQGSREVPLVGTTPTGSQLEPAIEVRLVKERQGLPGNFRPSRRLVLESLLRRKQSVMHIWGVGDTSTLFTVQTGCDWAICTPLPSDSSAGWGLYVTGRLGAVEVAGPRRDDLLKSDLKFTELVADIYSSLRQMMDLQRRLGQLKTFLPRPVLTVLAGMASKDIEAFLQPRQATVTVLFCDIRSFSRIAEQGQHDLQRLWHHVSEALGIMSSSILDQDGVIGDFQGDAIMAFWGWPLDVPNQVECALKASTTICQRLARTQAEGEDRFSCGIGVAQGQALVGRLGTPDQFKIGVFGPTVNLASRLESLSKRLGVSIVVDENCAQDLPALVGRVGGRARRLARVQPFGMTQQLTITELLPEVTGQFSLSETEQTDYDRALDALHEGRWTQARELLSRLSSDGPAAFLLRRYLDRHPQGPPPDWTGVIELDSK